MKINHPNRQEVSSTEQFIKFEIEFEKNVDFLEKLEELISLSGRIISFTSDTNFHHVNSNLLGNSVKTLKSIKLCCSIGSFSDANTLVRKLRDDLLLYVYMISVVNQREPFTKKSLDNISVENAEEFGKTFAELEFNPILTDDEKAIGAWLGNKVLDLPDNIKMKLSFKNYMKVLRSNQNIETVLGKYRLEKYWEVLREKLNNYVHNNGSQFTSHNLIEFNNRQLEIYLSSINIRTSYIISFFFVLITMVESSLLSSGDIIDYLDMGLAPPEGCQYEIAPFVQKFIDENVIKLHPELKQYLKENNINGMKID